MNRTIALLSAIACFLAFNLLTPSAYSQTTEQIAKGNCSACADVCQQTLSYCTSKKGKYGEQSMTDALKDCITSCKYAGDFLARGSRYSAKAAALCVDACMRCAKSCGSFNEDNNMKSCAEECRKCAGNCQKITAATGGAI